ncbi:MAG: hypothetical protein NC925_01270 [Candidatus Omnitrophica bacterium]|nr:hypothetical protein [Candidatus Omnitrophota bacterium]MCM8830778.1 hypothetical protein [Candidatus Omnitrophota bacterium]
MLDLSDRKIRRIIKRIREEVEKGIIHKLKGKPSSCAFSQRLKDKVINLYKGKYPDFDTTLSAEKFF